MKIYTSCFVGVPLPQRYQLKFEKLLIDVEKLYPNWEIAYTKTPHITVCYLDKQSQRVLTALAGMVQTKTRVLQKLVLTVNGFGYFFKEESKESILFLDVVYPAEFVGFNRDLSSELRQYCSVENNLSFHPHITVARVIGVKNELSLKKYASSSERKIIGIKWEFSVTEIVIYGVDSSKHPQYQTKLIIIPVVN